MCGISAIISKKNTNVIPLIIESLEQLQNRGYDSAGLSYYSQKKEQFIVLKEAANDAVDPINWLYNSVNTSEHIAPISIGHTRWATHGPKNWINSHPHTSMTNQFVIVHNGIIENYKIIKEKLMDTGFTFKTDTDTEVIANLLEYNWNCEEYSHNTDIQSTMISVIEKTCIMLEGTFGLAIMHKLQPDNVFITRNGSPLLFGENDNFIFIASEISGFNNQLTSYFTLNNHDIICINSSGIHTSTVLTSNEIDVDNFLTISKHPYAHWTLKEISEQPASLLRATNNGARLIGNSIKLGGIEFLRSHLSDISHLVLLGCGTSYNACSIAANYFRFSKVFDTIQYFDGAEFNKSNIPLTGITIVVLCSQSGETKDLHRCIKIARNHNCILVGIVNTVDSLIAREVDGGIYLNASREIAVASTKSFTSMLLVLSFFSIWMQQEIQGHSIIHERIINSARTLILQSESIINFCNTRIKLLPLIDKLIKPSMFILGKGKMMGIAHEAALKIKEICYIHAEGYSGSSLKHGPFALLEKDFPVILLIDNTNKTKMLNAYEEILSREAFCLIITEMQDITGDNVIHIPENKYYQEILFIITIQYIAYIIACKKGINPDKPRNLAKVVTVE
jgi:glutamine---fructose-6-phosphate transaminase (isomerizing)